MADDPFAFLEDAFKPKDENASSPDGADRPSGTDSSEKNTEQGSEEQRPKDWDEMPESLEDSGLAVLDETKDAALDEAKDAAQDIAESALEDIKNGRVPDAEKLADMAIERAKGIAQKSGAAAIDAAKEQAQRQVDNALSIVSNEFPILGGILGILSKPIIDFALKQVEMPEI